MERNSLGYIIRMTVLFFIVLNGLSVACLAQQAAWKSYKVMPNGDTFNRMDQRNLRQGKWMIEGIDDMEQLQFSFVDFVNNLPHGKWLKTTRDGMPVSEENYKNGLLDGESKYYEGGHLICLGNYLALRSKYEYDTVWVENPETNQLRPIRVKSNRGSVRHGFWTYYHPGTKQLARVTEYQVDSIIYSKEYREPADSVLILNKMKSWPHSSKADVLPGVWTTNPEKKPVRFTDFPEDGKGVKPNVRKK